LRQGLAIISDLSGIRYIAQAALNFVILLPSSPECWDYRQAPPQAAYECLNCATAQGIYEEKKSDLLSEKRLLLMSLKTLWGWQNGSSGIVPA
jgi:hypothetical protein